MTKIASKKDQKDHCCSDFGDFYKQQQLKLSKEKVRIPYFHDHLYGNQFINSFIHKTNLVLVNNLILKRKLLCGKKRRMKTF